MQTRLVAICNNVARQRSKGVEAGGSGSRVSAAFGDRALHARKEIVTTLSRSLESKYHRALAAGGRASGARIGRRAFGLLALAACLPVALPAHGASPRAELLPVVVSAGDDHDIKRWDASGKLITTIGSHDDAVNALLLVGGDTLLSAGADGKVKVWSLADNRMTRSLDAVKGAALSIAVTPDRGTLAIGAAGGKISLWNLLTGRKLTEADAHSDGVRALHFTSDASTLYSASADRQVRFWKVTLGGKPALDYQSNISAHDEAVNGLSVSADDRTIATISSDGFLKTWQRSGGGLINRIKVCDHGATAVAFSPDGRTLASGDEDGRVRLWNAASGAPISTLGSHDRAVTCLTWSADGKFVVSGGADKTIRYWSLDQGKQAARITAHDGAVKALVILP